MEENAFQTTATWKNEDTGTVHVFEGSRFLGSVRVSSDRVEVAEIVEENEPQGDSVLKAHENLRNHFWRQGLRRENQRHRYTMLEQTVAFIAVHRGFSLDMAERLRIGNHLGKVRVFRRFGNPIRVKRSELLADVVEANVVRKDG